MGDVRSNCGRDPQPREIENTVANIRAKRERGEASGALYQAWPPRAYAEIDQAGTRGNNRRRIAPAKPVPNPADFPMAMVETVISGKFPALSLTGRTARIRFAGSARFLETVADSAAR